MKSIKILEMFWQKSRDSRYNLREKEIAVLYYILNQFDKEGWPEAVTVCPVEIAAQIVDYSGYIARYLNNLERAGIIIGGGYTLSLPQIEENQESLEGEAASSPVEEPQESQGAEESLEGETASTPTEAELVVAEEKAEVVQAAQVAEVAEVVEATEFIPQRKLLIPQLLLPIPRQSRIIPLRQLPIPRQPSICNNKFAISNNSPPKVHHCSARFSARHPNLEQNRTESFIPDRFIRICTSRCIMLYMLYHAVS